MFYHSILAASIFSVQVCLAQEATLKHDNSRKRALVTGGAGFVGSHLVDSLMRDNYTVTVVDDLSTGRLANIEQWLNNSNFRLIRADVADQLLPLQLGKLDEIYHLASPASPAHYMLDPIKTIRTNSLGTMNMLNYVKLARDSATPLRLVLASTSEVYGDPKVHPQAETYWGNTNPVGPRSCYDESKRLAEALAIAYETSENVSIGIARIFNTFGPRMHQNDGRVVSNFITQLLQDKPITVYGNGNQTRSFQYVTDLVDGLRKLMAANQLRIGPVNLGNPNEITINSLAQRLRNQLGNSTSEIVFRKLPVDDPKRRCPNIDKANRLLGWSPVVSLETGLRQTIEYFVEELRSK